MKIDSRKWNIFVLIVSVIYAILFIVMGIILFFVAPVVSIICFLLTAILIGITSKYIKNLKRS